MKIAPGDSQLLIYDPSGAGHARLHVRLKEEAGLARVDVSADLDEAKSRCAQFPGPTLAVVFLDRSSKQQIFNFSRFFHRGLNKPVEVLIASADAIGPTLRKTFLELGAASVLEGADDDATFLAATKVFKDPTRFQPPRDPAPSALHDASPAMAAPRAEPNPNRRGSLTTPLAPERPAWDEEDSARHFAASSASSSSSSGIEGRSAAPPGKEGAPPVFRGFIPPGETPSGPQAVLRPPAAHVAILNTPSGPVAILRTPTRPAPLGKREAPGGKGLLLASILGVVGIVGGVGFGLWAISSGGPPSENAAVVATATPTPYGPPPPGVSALPPVTPTPRPPVASATPAGDVWARIDPNPPAAATVTPAVASANRRPPPAGTVVTIAELRRNVEQWKNASLTVEGVVTFSGGGYVPHRRQFNIQDATGGLVVDDPDVRGGDPPLEGDRVRVTGALGDYRGMQQVKLTGPIVRLGAGAPPEPLRLTSPSRFGEEIEGMLVRFDGVRLLSGVIPEEPTNINLRVATPGGEEVAIFIDLDTKIGGVALPATFSFQGFLYQYAWTDASRDYVWIVYPRRREDFLF